MNADRNHRLLIVDDNEAIHADFRKIFQPDDIEDRALMEAAAVLFGETLADRMEPRRFELSSATQGEQALKMVREAFDSGRPYAVAYVDVRMPPGWDGIETIQRLWEVDPDLQVVVCTAHSDYTLDQIISMLGQSDRFLLLKKPFETIEVYQLAIALTEKWHVTNKARMKQHHLEAMVEDRTRETVAMRDMIVFVLAELAESRDPETGRHLERIREYCRILCDQLRRGGPYADQIDDQFAMDLYHSSALHDIGKVAIPDIILLKPGRLNAREFEILKRHAPIGAEVLERAAERTGRHGILKMAIDVARYHHERYDGSGYPEGLRGTQIPLAARIIALPDVYDALTSARVYKEAYDPDVARAMIEKESGSHFDPVIVEAFLARYDDFLRVRDEAADEEPPIPWTHREPATRK